jgi:hypothetical protein
VSSSENGQALVELIVVLPVLLLLLLAAADMGKLFVISGKSEIAARYIVLRHFRAAPFGDLYPAHSAGEQIERIFFDDALDDDAPMDEEDADPDITYTEFGEDELIYTPLDMEDTLLTLIWDHFEVVRGVRSRFAYDLPFFPYGREHPFEETVALQEGATEGLASAYDANGDFVCLIEAFSGQDGQQVRVFMEAGELTVGFGTTALSAFLAALNFFFNFGV